MSAELSESLYFTEGSSNKVYHTQLVAKDGGFVVNFQYGPRGKNLTAGTKTAEPLPYDKARKIFDKLVAEKKGKGYTPCESGETYKGVEQSGRKTQWSPMLLNAIDKSQAALLDDNPQWVSQEKHNGERQIAALENGEFYMTNRKGLRTTFTDTLETMFKELARLLGVTSLVLDGERLGDGFKIFDVLRLGDEEATAKTLASRLGVLERIDAALGFQVESTVLSVTKTAVTAAEKKALAKWAEQEGREGVVYKRIDSTYTAGRPASGGSWLKLKYTESASCRVAGQNEGKRSVQIEVLKDGLWVDVGNVTIPANHKIPSTGAIVEVRYLYAFPNGSLFQPVYLGERKDIGEEDCRADKLKLIAA